MITKRASKTLSLFLAFCMMVTLLPTVAFAETVDVDSGVPLGVSGIITDFAPMDESVAQRTVDFGTTEDELNLPTELTATLTIVSEITADVGGNNIGANSGKQETTTSEQEAEVSENGNVTDSNFKEHEVQEPDVNTEEIKATVAVSKWNCQPAYDGTVAGTNIFIPVLVLTDGLSIADDVTVPQITITVQDAPTLLSMRAAAEDAFQVEGGAAYATLEEAAANVLNNGTITMLKDVTVSKPTLVNNEYGIVLKEDKNYTIDFGGYTLCSGDNSRIKLRLLRIAAGSVTLRNGTIRASYDAMQDLRPEAIVVSTTVNIYDMSIVSSYAPVLSASNGNITIWAGRFEAFGGDLTPLNEELGQIVLAKDSTVVPASGWKNNSVVGGVVTVTAAADVTPPSILSVAPPWYTAAAVSGNVIIEFSERMDRETAGTVQLNSLPALTGGAWVNSTTYTIPYSGLENSTGYTVNISGFKDEAGNVMDAVTSGYTFTTLPSAASNDLKTALRDTTAAEITISSNITLDERVEIGASHTLTIPAAYTLTIVDKGAIQTSGKTLTINGGGTITIAITRGVDGVGGIGNAGNGTLNLENVTVNLQNTYSSGIRIQTINVGSGATINLNTTTGYYLITMVDGYALNVNSGGKINIENFKDTGIFNIGGTVHVNGGEIVVGKGQGRNEGINNYNMSPGLLKISNGGKLTGTDEGKIRLYADSKVEGVNGIIKDRGKIFSEEGLVTVAAATAAPSESTLSHGMYIWDGNMFSKEGVIFSVLPQSASVTEGKITDSLSAKATASNGAEVSYQWSRSNWIDEENRWDYGTEIPGATNESYPIPQDLTAGKYGFYVTVSATGCENVSTKSNMATVTVNPTPTPTITEVTVPMDLTYAAGFFLNFNVTFSEPVSVVGTPRIALTVGTETKYALYTGNAAENRLNFRYVVQDTDVASDGIVLSSPIDLDGGTIKNTDGTDAVLAFTPPNTSGILVDGVSPVIYTIRGTIKGSDTNAGIENADVIIKTPEGIPYFSISTNSDGEYNSNPLTAGTYSMEISAPGYDTVTINNIVISGADAVRDLTLIKTDSTISPIEITGFETIADEHVGKAGSAICANVSEVINLLRAIHPYANAMHSGNQTALCLITGWEDKDGYNPNKAGSYTFTADVAILPGFSNSAGHKVTVEVVVAPSDATITITKHPQNVTVTQGRISATLTAEAVTSNGKPVRYQWRQFIGGIGSDNTQPMLGETSNTFAIPTGLPAGTYQYLCVFNTDGTDYVDSNTAIVTVNPPSGGDNGDSGGGSSGDNGGSGVVVTPPAPDAPNAPTQGSVNIHGTVDASGNVTANITNQTVIDAIDRALTQARQNGTEQNGIILTLNISTGGMPVNNLSVNLPKEVQDAIIARGVVGLVITAGGSDIALGMDLAALREMNRQANGNVSLTATRIDNGTLAGNARGAIGSRPVFDLKASYGNGKQVQSFSAGSVSITIPYTLSANENARNIQAVYVDANGRVQWLISSVYDGLNGVLRFSTNHFSTYGVGYKQAAPNFTDIGNHWAKEDIAFVANRGLLSGTSKTTFSPNTAMTRGMFVTALGRLANADVSGYEKSSFTDVKSDAYYMGYVEWANKNNIVKGIGGGKFAPDQSITREQMAVILQSYAKAIGFTLPKVYAENTFADSAKISAYSNDAMKQMQMAGVISGKNGNLFDPQGTAIRAEVSAVLRRFVELAISSDAAQGWTRNNSGKWMYYENGKPVTGKKDIDGSTYIFDQYGVTADIPKNLKYTTYTVQKGDSFWLIAHKLGCAMGELERLNNKSRFDLIHPGDVLRVPEE